MKQYTIDWNEDAYGRASFAARDQEHALEILERLRNGELSEDDVFTWKRETEVSTNFTSLREVQQAKEN